MKDEDYIVSINNDIDLKVDEVIEDLEELAVMNNIQVEYVLENFRDKIVYRINERLK